MTGADDRELVAACLAGTATAFDVLVERHRRRSIRSAIASSATTRTPSDLAQDVFLRAYRALHTFKGDSAFWTWLYRVAVNVCLNRVSSKAPASEPIERREHRTSSGETPDRDVLRQERAATVRAAIARLPNEAARDDDPAHVSRAAARADRGDSRQLGRRREGELLSRAGQPEEVAAGERHDESAAHLAEPSWSTRSTAC